MDHCWEPLIQIKLFIIFFYFCLILNYYISIRVHRLHKERSISIEHDVGSMRKGFENKPELIIKMIGRIGKKFKAFDAQMIILLPVYNSPSNCTTPLLEHLLKTRMWVLRAFTLYTHILRSIQKASPPNHSTEDVHGRLITISNVIRERERETHKLCKT